MKTNKYQKGKEPTSEEMKSFCNRFSKEEWDKLCENKVFVETYDKDLNLLSTAAEMILSNRYVGSTKDIK